MTPPEQTFEVIPIDQLLEKVQALRRQNLRLVQISATRLAEQLELTYSFDLDRQLTNLRLHIPAEGATVPSITGIYWGAFLYENELHDLFNLDVKGIAVDFQGNLYKTAIKFPFGSTKVPGNTPATGARTPSSARPAQNRADESVHAPMPNVPNKPAS